MLSETCSNCWEKAMEALNSGKKKEKKNNASPWKATGTLSLRSISRWPTGSLSLPDVAIERYLRELKCGGHKNHFRFQEMLITTSTSSQRECCHTDPGYKLKFAARLQETAAYSVSGYRMRWVTWNAFTPAATRLARHSRFCGCSPRGHMAGLGMSKRT